MPKRKITIEVDVPAGWELVDYRAPQKGERYLCIGRVYQARWDPDDSDSRPIVRRAFEWPEWIKPGTWMARDENGKTYLYSNKPIREEGRWFSGVGRWLLVECLQKFTDFPTPPLCDDWRESLIQKPLEDD